MQASWSTHPPDMSPFPRDQWVHVKSDNTRLTEWMCVSIVCPPTSKNEPDIWHQQFKKWYFTLRGSSFIFLELFLLPTIRNSGVTIFWILDDNYYTEQTTWQHAHVKKRVGEEEEGDKGQLTVTLSFEVMSSVMVMSLCIWQSSQWKDLCHFSLALVASTEKATLTHTRTHTGKRWALRATCSHLLAERTHTTSVRSIYQNTEQQWAAAHLPQHCERCRRSGVLGSESKAVQTTSADWDGACIMKGHWIINWTEWI